MSEAAVSTRDHHGRSDPRLTSRSHSGPTNSGDDDFAAFSALVGDIYDASVDPARWPAVLVKVREFAGGAAAALFSKDMRVKSLNVFYDCGTVDHRYTWLCNETYAKLDPTPPWMQRQSRWRRPTPPAPPMSHTCCR